ncbi:hypothetical protein [Amycolatopsis sp. NPDC004079]|uniref:hypothetical protein n=1 Tax=Amycolatopsis sp. NPDC004079 TaxID=3154549 RepID=UPI00339E25FD
MTALAHEQDAPAKAEVPRMREQPRFTAAIDLVALPTAVSVARMFVSGTLRRWNAMFIEPDMEDVAAELVKLSVQATGPREETSWQNIEEVAAIKVCLVGWRRHIVLEVTDQRREELVLPDGSSRPSTSGLGLVDARAGRWGSCRTPWGRVNWAELAVHKRTKAELPKHDVKPSPYPRDSHASPASGEYPVLLQRVVDGLEKL